jgi:hypothetical protein
MNLNLSRRERCCCAVSSTRRQNMGRLWTQAKWIHTLRNCGTCPPKVFLSKNTVISSAPTTTSKKMQQAQLAKTTGRGWRKVNWRKFQLERQTKDYIKKGNLLSSCPPGTTLTAEQINNLRWDDPRLPAIPVTCASKGEANPLLNLQLGAAAPCCPGYKYRIS